MIQQPESIKGRRWFFQTGLANFGAAYGQTLDKRTVEARLRMQAGEGELVLVDGLWYWKTKR